MPRQSLPRSRQLLAITASLTAVFAATSSVLLRNSGISDLSRGLIAGFMLGLILLLGVLAVRSRRAECRSTAQKS